MTKFYCDHGAYSAYSATPTWGVPQDGDGKAKTASTAAAQASIVFSGVPAGSISVCGVSLSPTFATDANTSANNLAAAINAATGVVSTTGFRSGAVQLRNAVYARGPAGGAPAGTCQIMTRMGSADFNGQVAIAHSLTNVNAGSSSLNFSGGVSGCWGYVFNNAGTIWPSSLGLGQYGIFAANKPFADTTAPGDVIAIRSGKTVAVSPNNYITVTPANMGSAAAPIVFEVDDSTEWSDGTNPVLKFSQANTGNINWIMFAANASAFFHVKAKKYSTGQRSLVFESTGTNFSNGSLFVQTGTPMRLENVDFYCPGSYSATSNYVQVMGGFVGSVAATTEFVGCRFLNPAQTTVPFTNFTNGSIANFYGCEFAQQNATSAQTAGVLRFFPNGNASASFRFVGCKFTGFVVGSKLHSEVQWCEGTFVDLIDCDFGNITVRGQTISTMALSYRARNGIKGSSVKGLRDFFYETTTGFCEWNSSKGFPTLNAVLHDEVTPWSLFLTTTNVPANIAPRSPFESPLLYKENSGSDGAKTLTVNLLVESTLGWTQGDIWAVISYTDSAGNLVTTDTYSASGVALTTSTASWSSTTFNGQTWLPRKFSISLPDVKGGSILSVQLLAAKSVANDTLGVFVDPEMVLS